MRSLSKPVRCPVTRASSTAGLVVLAMTLGLLAPARAVQVTFTFVPPMPAQSVYLAGTFNNWSPSALAMTAKDGVFTATLELAPGRYLYKYVLDGNTWREDPHAPNGFVDDGYGGKNGVVEIPADVTTFAVGKATPEPGGAAPVPATGEAVTGLRKVTFRYTPPIGGVTQIMLAGTFNDWNVGATPMQDTDGDGTWEVTLMLAPGDYQYKFVVDGKWTTDMQADGFAPDGFGGQNSVIRVDARFESIDVARGDGKFYLEDITYEVDYDTVNPVSPTRLVFTARAHVNDVEGIDVVYRKGDGADQTIPMQPVGEDPALEYFRAGVDLPDASTEVRFCFVYRDGGKRVYMTPSGQRETLPDTTARYVYSSSRLPVFEVPEWVRDGVIYQIFPERFYNGDPSNDPDFSEPMYVGRTTLPASGKTNDEYFHLVRDWTDIAGLVSSPYRTDGRPDYYSFYGGDIEGVRQKLPYLQDLGVTILYFNPLNVARSNHKYDPCDYRIIDPHFADDATFQRFTREAHERGIRIIVDMAYNHCGDCSPRFQDSWQKGPESEFYNWFEWKRWPPPAGVHAGSSNFKADDYYACWWGFGIHPDLNFDLGHPAADEHQVRDIAHAQVNQPLVDYVLSSVDYWLGDMGVDGFRLDVPNEVPFWFWGLFMQRVRQVKPDAYLVGELWGNASDWIRPDVFHATMNYKYFRDPVQKFLAQGQGTAASFDRELAPGRWQYPQQCVEAQMNLVDSHDTVRLATLLQGDRKRQQLVALFGMTYVGAPHIYYGDEIGLEGGKDPDCRRPFPWHELQQRKELHDFYKNVIALRHAHPALRRGTFRAVVTQGMQYGFLREAEGDRLLVLLNNSAAAGEARVPLVALGASAGSFKELLGGDSIVSQNKDLVVPLAGLSGAVIAIPAAGASGRP